MYGSDQNEGIIRFFCRPQEKEVKPSADETQRLSADALCDSAAQRYEEGDGEQAFKLWLAAAEKEHDHAQYCLGVCYLEGLGVACDYAKAFEWFERSARQGNLHAQFNLALCYEQGVGVKEDRAAAFEWC